MNPDRRINVLLVDDHEVVRAGYRVLLENVDDIHVLSEADSGEQAIRQFMDLSPDVVIMDLSLPGMGGLEAIRRIVSRDSNARILVFSMHEDTIFVEQALQAGAKGYITKRSASDVLVEAIRKVAEGGQYLESSLIQHLATHKALGRNTPFVELSPREFEVFCLLAEGLKVNDISERLCLSNKTVANYSTQVKSKLDTNTTAELARLAIRHGLIDA